VANRTLVFMLVALLILGGAVGWFILRNRANAGPSTPLAPESKAYVRNLKLSEVTMKATESYVGQTVTEIEGKIGNAGDRVVKRADVFCIFYNSYGEIVIRERVPIISTPLKPGDTRSFRLPFDDIPAGWNNQMPQLVIARIDFN